jgi:thiamine pyrophosphokinase
MKQKMVKAYHIEHDGCYSNIVMINTHKDHVDNYHTTFFKLADAKRELLNSLKYHIDQYTYAAKRIRAINNETVPKRATAE